MLHDQVDTACLCPCCMSQYMCVTMCVTMSMMYAQAMPHVHVHANVYMFVPVSMSTVSMDRYIQHGNRHAAEHRHEARTWTCSMDMDVQHENGHAAWT
jgi:hypothetical protein